MPWEPDASVVAGFTVNNLIAYLLDDLKVPRGVHAETVMTVIRWPTVVAALVAQKLVILTEEVLDPAPVDADRVPGRHSDVERRSDDGSVNRIARDAPRDVKADEERRRGGLCR
jgi:hypothetical protein